MANGIIQFKVYSSFPVRYKISNVGIFYLFNFENELEAVVSLINLNNNN